MRIEHFAVALALVLIHPLQRPVVEHAVLAIAALHLQRRIGHRFAAPGIYQRGAVGKRRLGAERVQALPGLPRQHQQREQDQQESHHD
ncbi:hypothetical protein D3C75_357800 [compost metagenome]